MNKKAEDISKMIKMAYAASLNTKGGRLEENKRNTSRKNKKLYSNNMILAQIHQSTMWQRFCAIMCEKSKSI